MPLRVTIELIPHGDESKTSILGQLVIENTNEGTHELGIYDYSLIYGDANSEYPRNFAQASGTLHDFHRRLGSLALVHAVLNRIAVTSPFMWYEPSPAQQSDPL